MEEQVPVANIPDYVVTSPVFQLMRQGPFLCLTEEEILRSESAAWIRPTSPILDEADYLFFMNCLNYWGVLSFPPDLLAFIVHWTGPPCLDWSLWTDTMMSQLTQLLFTIRNVPLQRFLLNRKIHRGKSQCDHYLNTQLVTGPEYTVAIDPEGDLKVWKTCDVSTPPLSYSMMEEGNPSRHTTFVHIVNVWDMDEDEPFSNWFLILTNDRVLPFSFYWFLTLTDDGRLFVHAIHPLVVTAKPIYEEHRFLQVTSFGHMNIGITTHGQVLDWWLMDKAGDPVISNAMSLKETVCMTNLSRGITSNVQCLGWFFEEFDTVCPIQNYISFYLGQRGCMGLRFHDTPSGQVRFVQCVVVHDEFVYLRDDGKIQRDSFKIYCCAENHQELAELVKLVPGKDHLVCIGEDGSVKTYVVEGKQVEGQEEGSGIPNCYRGQLKNEPLFSDGERFIDVQCSGDHSLGLRVDGSLRVWGCDETHEKRKNMPTESGFVRIAHGPSQLVAMRADGTVIFWGKPNEVKKTENAHDDYN